MPVIAKPNTTLTEDQLQWLRDIKQQIFRVAAAYQENIVMAYQ